MILKNRKPQTHINESVNLSAILIVCFFPLLIFCLSYFIDIGYLSLNIIFLIASTFYLLPKFVLWLINSKNKKESLYKLKYRPELIILYTFFIWMIISCFFSKTPAVSFLGMNQEGYFFEEGLVQFVAYACIFYFAYNIKNEDSKILILKTFSLISLIIVLLAFRDQNNAIFPAFQGCFPYSAMFLNPNHFGYFLTIAILVNVGLFIFEKDLIQKIFFLLNTILLMIYLLINSSFGPALAVFITLILLPFLYRIFKQKWNIFTFLPIIIFAIAAYFIRNAAFYKDFIVVFDQSLQLLGINVDVSSSFTPQTNAPQTDVPQQETINTIEHIKTFGSSRVELWLHSFNLIIQNPIFGIGLGNFQYNGEQTRPHNEILQYTVNTGILGGLLYTAFIITIFVRAIKQRKSTNNVSFVSGIAVFGYLISSFFGNTMPHVMPFFIIMLAMYISSFDPLKQKIK